MKDGVGTDRGVALIAVAHGTRSPAGQSQISALAGRVVARRPGLDLRLSYVDVQWPRPADVLGRLDRPAVVVPLLLTAGYHVRVDIADAVSGAVAQAGGEATDAGRGLVLAPPLGFDRCLVEVLAGRIAEAGPADAVVLAAAGSRDARCLADVEAVAAALPVPTEIAYAAGGPPRAVDVVARLRAGGARRVVIAAYLLVDGLFHRALHRAGADVVTAPLATAPDVVDLVLHRYDAGRRELDDVQAEQLRGALA